MNPIQVIVSEDALEARLKVDPSSLAGPLQSEDVRRVLQQAGVKLGILEDQVTAACRQAETGEPLDICIARGAAPEVARPGFIELLVKPRLTPVSQTGRIDYRESRQTISVELGKVFAIWHPPLAARDGWGVDGREFPMKEANAEVAHQPSGEGWSLEPLGQGRSRLRATRTGVLEHAPESTSISILERLQIDGDIDLGTGNLRTQGHVQLKGSIQNGAVVEVSGNLEVSGTVERATLVVGGDLTVEGDLFGGGESVVSVGGSAYLRHARNVTLEVDGDLELETGALDAHVECGGLLRATGTPGQLRGGTYVAEGGAIVNDLGSPRGVYTVLAVGAGAQLAEERQALEQELERAQAGLAKLRREISGIEVRRVTSHLDRAQVAKVRNSMKQRLELQRRERNLKLCLEQLGQVHAQDPSQAPTIDVHGRAYGGVRLQILGRQRILREPRGPCTFVLDPKTDQIVLRDLRQIAS